MKYALGVKGGGGGLYGEGQISWYIGSRFLSHPMV